MQIAKLYRPSASVSRDPFATLAREIDQLFQAPLGFVARSRQAEGYVPALDVTEDAENIVVHLDVPGIDPKNVQVSLCEDVLTISGERKIENECKEGQCYRYERVQGRFERSLELPKPVRADAVKAAYKDGVLTVTLPKTEEAKPRQINIAVN